MRAAVLTATELGAATIYGPGDLAAVDQEAFLYFDGGDNQNWVVSNLVIPGSCSSRNRCPGRRSP
jgi:hypothetical protein